MSGLTLEKLLEAKSILEKDYEERVGIKAVGLQLNEIFSTKTFDRDKWYMATKFGVLEIEGLND